MTSYSSNGSKKKRNDERRDSKEVREDASQWTQQRGRRDGELSQRTRLSIYPSPYVPTLTDGHELCVMSERTKPRIQVGKMSFLCGWAGWEAARLCGNTDAARVKVFHTMHEFQTGLWRSLTQQQLLPATERPIRRAFYFHRLTFELHVIRSGLDS